MGYPRRMQKHMVEELHHLFDTTDLDTISADDVGHIVTDLKVMNDRIISSNSFGINSFGINISTINPHYLGSIIGNALFGTNNDDPIIVPLPQEVRNTLEEHIYNSASMEPNTCSICRAHFANGEYIVTTKCNHEFHKLCINQWFRMSVRCPNCRADQRDL